MDLYTPFSTRLSSSARETELRLRSIFQWKRRRPPVALLALVLAAAVGCGGLVACQEEPSAFAELPGSSDIGKTLNELQKEHPEGEIMVDPAGLPDSAIVCFGEPESEYRWCFFGTQSGDAEKAMNELEEQLKCAGGSAAAKVLFPEMEDEMSFEAFFSLIGVEDYEYFVETDNVAEGWLRCSYQDMEIWINTNEPVAGGGWKVAGAQTVRGDAPVVMIDPEIFLANEGLAAPVMFY